LFKYEVKSCEFYNEKYQPTRPNQKFCTTDCSNLNKTQTKFLAWVKNDFNQYKFGPLLLKKFLVKLYGYKCLSCGISTWKDKPIGLELEHDDGDSENNSPQNLSLLCPNCHSQTPTFKAKNKGHGRHVRKQRYADGKSF